MIIQSIEIENFRNFTKFQANFNEFNVIIGENNIGKTNLLRSIDFVLNPRLNYHNLEINEGDFQDVNLPIKIKLILVEIDPDIAKDLDFDVYDPEEDILRIEFIAFWDEDSADFKKELNFVNREFKDIEDKKIVQRKQRNLFPFFPIYAERSAEKTLKLSTKEDFGTLVNYFLPEITTPITILKSNCKAIIDEFRDQSNDIIDPEALILFCNQILDSILDYNYSNLMEDLNKISVKYSESSHDIEIPSEINEVLIQIIDKYKRKIRIFYIKSKNQQILDELSNNVKNLNEFQDLSSECLKILQDISNFSTFDLNLQVVDEEKIFNSPIFSIDSFSILLHGTGFQQKMVIALKLLNIVTFLKTQGLKSAFIAIEEPESNLYPQHQRDLVSRIREFTKKIKEELKINLQIIITSHSAEILRRLHFSDLIILKKETGTVSYRIPADFIDTMTNELAEGQGPRTRLKNNLIKSMQNLFRFYPETFFSKVIILGEGETEEGAFPEYSKTLGKDFDSNGITFVCAKNDGNMKYYKKILDKINIPYFYVLDSDNGKREIVEPNEILTKEKAFEYEVFSVLPISKILDVLLQLIPEETGNQWLNDLIPFLPEGVNTIEELFQYSLENELNENIIEFFKKRLPENKGSLLGYLIGAISSSVEIPESYRSLIEKAYTKAHEVS